MLVRCRGTMHSLTDLISADLLVILIREIPETRHGRIQSTLDRRDFLPRQDLTVSSNRANEYRPKKILMVVKLRHRLRGIRMLVVNHCFFVLNAEKPTKGLKLRTKLYYMILVLQLSNQLR